MTKAASLIAGALVWAGFAPVFFAQDAGAGQAPLADVVRHQQAERQRGKPAKHVLSDDDLPSASTHQITGMVSGQRIIPYIRITGTVPNSVAKTVALDVDQKMYAWIGQGLLDSCFDLDCAEKTYVNVVPRLFSGTVRILFDSNETVQSYQARVAHIEIMHQSRGRMLGLVAFIKTPEATGAASCFYRAADASEVESECDAFVHSLQVIVPEKYIYVQNFR